MSTRTSRTLDTAVTLMEPSPSGRGATLEPSPSGRGQGEGVRRVLVGANKALSQHPHPDPLPEGEGEVGRRESVTLRTASDLVDAGLVP
jgi:hypothetical protein